MQTERKGGRLKAWSRDMALYPLALWRAYWEEDLTNTANALVYMTLLTLVPLLAVAFALLSGFGLQNAIEPWLHNVFAPMGQAGSEVVEHLVRFVGQAQAGSLGAVGVVFLLVSVMGLAYKIEATLNGIWQVEGERSLPVRFAAYSSIVLLAPLLLGALMSMLFNLQHATWLQAHVPWLAKMMTWLTGVVPLMLTFLALAALYRWIPNCRVRWWPAICGAVFFLALWFPVSALFSMFIATSSNYSIIYSGFASVVIMLIWLNYLWLLFLMGAKLSVLVQRPQARVARQTQWQGDEAFATAVAVAAAVFNAFRRGEKPMDAQALALQVGSTPPKVGEVLKRLQAAGILVTGGGKSAHYLPAKAVAHYSLLDVYHALASDDMPLKIAGNCPFPAFRARYLAALDVPVVIGK